MIAPVANALLDTDDHIVGGHIFDLSGVTIDQQLRSVDCRGGLGQARLYWKKLAQTISATGDGAARHAVAAQVDECLDCAACSAQQRRHQAYRHRRQEWDAIDRVRVDAEPRRHVG